MGPAGKLSGEVEADETFICGKTRNMHKEKRARKINRQWRHRQDSRHGDSGARRQSAYHRYPEPEEKKAVQAEVRKHVEAGSALYTDALQSYSGLNEFEHQVIDHAAYGGRQNPHERFGKLLVVTQTRPQWNLCQRRTIPSFPVPR
jgi:hypothetical protein